MCENDVCAEKCGCGWGAAEERACVGVGKDEHHQGRDE